MKVITRPEAIQTVTYPDIRQLIHIRFLQNEMNKDNGYIIKSFLVVEANDPAQRVQAQICDLLRQIETVDGMPLDEEFTPSYEWILEHPTCYEAAFIHCDRIFAVTVLIPKDMNIDHALLGFFSAHAEPIPDMTQS